MDKPACVDCGVPESLSGGLDGAGYCVSCRPARWAHEGAVQPKIELRTAEDYLRVFGQPLSDEEIARISKIDAYLDDMDADPSAPGAHPVQTADGRDLETLVILLEMAALSLWTLESDTFTRDALVNRAREYAGPGLVLRDIDLNLVINSAGFLKKVRGGLQVR